MGQRGGAPAHGLAGEHGPHRCHARDHRTLRARFLPPAPPPETAVSSISDPVVSRRDRWHPATLVVAPAVLYLLIRLLGYMKYLKLAALATVALGGAAALFVRPRWGLWLLVFYIYAGISFYFSINVAALITFIIFSAVILDLVLGVG